MIGKGSLVRINAPGHHHHGEYGIVTFIGVVFCIVRVMSIVVDYEFTDYGMMFPLNKSLNHIIVSISKHKVVEIT